MDGKLCLFCPKVRTLECNFSLPVVNAEKEQLLPGKKIT